MLELTQENPFNELPEALVVDMLNQCGGIGRKLSKSFQYLFESKKDIRKQLKDENLLKKDADLLLPLTYL